MPTLTNATIVGHLYREPKEGVTNGKKWAMINFYTSDKVKEEKKFSSWTAFVQGFEADWLIRDGKKGSLVCVSGSIRIYLDEYEGKSTAKGEFTRVHKAMVLDAEREGQPAAPTKPSEDAGYSDPTPF